jgi:thioredoxin-dependent peroxiredoxin
MSKKTRKKSPAKPSSKLSPKPAKKTTKPALKSPAKTRLKTSKPVSVKKSSSKAAAKPKTTAAAKTIKAPSGTTAKVAPAAKTPVADKPERTIGAKSAPPTPRGAAAPAGPLAEGQPAPAFDLPRDGGERLSLRDFAGRKLVLFFYPRADTPGCTKEAMDFSRLSKEFEASGADVVGVSADSLKAQESFRNKHELKTPLISDEHQEMLKAYGVWGEKSMYGRTFLGILRTTILIGPKGKIARIWRHVKVDGHADEVLAAVQSL